MLGQDPLELPLEQVQLSQRFVLAGFDVEDAASSSRYRIHRA